MIHGKMKIGIRVTTRALGKSRKYAPMTPAMAPEAPMTGMVEFQLKRTCENTAKRPQVR